MNVCSPTSPPCRRTGVLSASIYSVILCHTDIKGWNCTYFMCICTLCVHREPVEGEEGPYEWFACWDRRHHWETYWDAESRLQNTPQVNNSRLSSHCNTSVAHSVACSILTHSNDVFDMEFAKSRNPEQQQYVKHIPHMPSPFHLGRNLLGSVLP